MKSVLVIGGGQIGEVIAHFLTESGTYNVTIADQDADRLSRLPRHDRLDTVTLDATDDHALKAAMAGKYAVLTACPYTINAHIARAAHSVGLHYFDLTEDVESTRLVKHLAESSRAAFVPQCGLAPGFISIAAFDLARQFDTLEEIRLRVGALPQYPTNVMKYNLTWSTDGLINEYSNPCEAIVDGQHMMVPPLAELEHFSIDGQDFEAFNTSGGLGTLADTLNGAVQTLNYRTIRYPGHRDFIRLLLNDLKLSERRDLARDLFEHALPTTPQDVVVIFVTVTGKINGRLTQKSFAKKVYAGEVYGRHCTAIQITTASGICAMLDLMVAGKLPDRGFVRQEDTRLEDFLKTRFGAQYA